MLKAGLTNFETSSGSLIEREGYVSFCGNEVKATEFIESSAYRMFILSGYEDLFFDEGVNGVHNYNDSLEGEDDQNPYIIRETAPDDYPLKNEHPYVLRLHWADRATHPTSPGLAGVYPNGYYGVNNAVHEQVLYLKAPAGLTLRTVNTASESYEWTTDITTGDWQEIHLKRTYTTSDSWDIGGHIYFYTEDPDSLPNEFDIYLGAFMILDITENPEFFYANLIDSSVAFRILPGGVAISDSFIEDETATNVSVYRDPDTEIVEKP